MTKPTFENFSPIHQGREELGHIGMTPKHPAGVADEMARVFGFAPDVEMTAVDYYGGLIRAVGPAKELQENIGQVQAVLGTANDANKILRGWVMRSGLLAPVERSFMDAEMDLSEEDVDLAVITSGVRNWMARRATRLEDLLDEREVDGVLLAAGNRRMKMAEGPDVVDGMTEADFMHDVIAPRLGRLGLARVELVAVDSGVGDEVMRVAADKVHELVDLNIAHVAVVSNAGAWPQNAGTLRRAALDIVAGFDGRGQQLEVVSDLFPLAAKGEPAATHQNPYTTPGQIARNLQEFARHTT